MIDGGLLPLGVLQSITEDRGDDTFDHMEAFVYSYTGSVSSMKKDMLLKMAPHKRPNWVAASPEQLVLENAKPVRLGNITDCGYPAMREGNCFGNAFELALRHPELKYHEGWALFEQSIPTHHGWVVDADGKVHDPTWIGIAKRHQERKGKTSTRAVYMGIHVPLDQHIRWLIEHGTCNLLATNEMTEPSVFELGMAAYDATPPLNNDLDTHREITLDCIFNHGHWEFDESTNIFTHSRTGQRWCGIYRTYLEN